MDTEAVKLETLEVRKLLGTASADAALLYIYLKAGNSLRNAEDDLHMSAGRVSCAGAALRQLGLWEKDKPCHAMVGERPSYTEQDVLEASRGPVPKCRQQSKLFCVPELSSKPCRKVFL